MKPKAQSAPVCVFCKRSGAGVTFAIYNPRFAPFGTACTDCERDLPKDATVPNGNTVGKAEVVES